MTLNGGSIAGNTAEDDGGGIYNTGMDAKVILNGGSISGNRATEQGGGIYNGGAATVTLIEGSITGNRAEEGGGIFDVARTTGGYNVFGDISLVSGNSTGPGPDLN